MLRIAVAAVFIVANLAQVAQAAARRTVSASGQAVITKGQRGVARAQAINGALRSAVGQVVQQLGGPAEGDDAATDKNVYERAAAYVPSSTVVTENVDGTILTVELNVDIETD